MEDKSLWNPKDGIGGKSVTQWAMLVFFVVVVKTETKTDTVVKSMLSAFVFRLGDLHRALGTRQSLRRESSGSYVFFIPVDIIKTMYLNHEASTHLPTKE